MPRRQPRSSDLAIITAPKHLLSRFWWLTLPLIAMTFAWLIPAQGAALYEDGPLGSCTVTQESILLSFQSLQPIQVRVRVREFGGNKHTMIDSLISLAPGDPLISLSTKWLPSGAFLLEAEDGQRRMLRFFRK